jgi:hypothetical protein
MGLLASDAQFELRSALSGMIDHDHRPILAMNIVLTAHEQAEVHFAARGARAGLTSFNPTSC